MSRLFQGLGLKKVDKLLPVFWGPDVVKASDIAARFWQVFESENINGAVPFENFSVTQMPDLMPLISVLDINTGSDDPDTEVTPEMVHLRYMGSELDVFYGTTTGNSMMAVRNPIIRAGVAQGINFVRKLRTVRVGGVIFEMDDFDIMVEVCYLPMTTSGYEIDRMIAYTGRREIPKDYFAKREEQPTRI